MIFDIPARPELDNYGAPEYQEALQHHRSLLEELEHEITHTAGHINAIDYYFIKLLDKFDEHEAWTGEGVKSFAHWLNWKCGLGQVMAREKVRVARALRTLPKIDAAFATGAISYSKVRAMTRVANPVNEPYLLFLAEEGTAQHIESAVKRYKQARTVDDAERPGYEKGFYYYQDSDGMYVFNGRLPAEEGAVVVKAMDVMAEVLYRDRQQAEAEAKPDTDYETDRQTKECGLQPENVSAETFEGKSPDQYCDRATTLALVADHFLASRQAMTSSNDDRYHIYLHVNATNTDLDNKISSEPTCWLDQDRFLAPSVARQLACDASVSTLLKDDNGHVLDIGRRSRVVPKPLRLAVELRDQGCRFPNCHQRRHTDQHHIIHWADGGRTDITNLVTLCRHHHGLIHKGEFSVETSVKPGHDPNDIAFIFRNADGAEIRRAFWPQYPDQPPIAVALERIKANNKARGIDITSTTAVTKWLGDRYDAGNVVAGMYQADGLP